MGEGDAAALLAVARGTFSSRSTFLQSLQVSLCTKALDPVRDTLRCGQTFCIWRCNSSIWFSTVRCRASAGSGIAAGEIWCLPSTQLKYRHCSPRRLGQVQNSRPGLCWVWETCSVAFFRQ